MVEPVFIPLRDCAVAGGPPCHAAALPYGRTCGEISISSGVVDKIADRSD